MSEDDKERCYFLPDGRLMVRTRRRDYLLPLPETIPRDYEKIQHYKTGCRFASEVVSLDGLLEHFKNRVLGFVSEGLARCGELEAELKKAYEQDCEETRKRHNFRQIESDVCCEHVEKMAGGTRVWQVAYSRERNETNTLDIIRAHASVKQ